MTRYSRKRKVSPSRHSSSLLKYLFIRLGLSPRFWIFMLVIIVLAYVFLPQETVGKLFIEFGQQEQAWAKQLYSIKYRFFPNSQQPPLSELWLEEEGPGTADHRQAADTSCELDEAFAFPQHELTADELIVYHSAYTVCYNTKHKLPRWVAYRLEASELEGSMERINRFAPDPKVPGGTALPSDYTGTGYDRGHLAAAADFGFDRQAYEETFLMSNIAPQTPALNRGTWRLLEEATRRWARREQALYIVTGPILQEPMKRIGRRNRVSVPPAFFKVILDMTEPEVKALAFIMPNTDELSQNFMDYLVTIEQVEQQTGLNFFPCLDQHPELRQFLETQLHADSWLRR